MPNELMPQWLPAGVTAASPTQVARLDFGGAREGTDAWCVAYWLQTCASKSEHTQRAYRREAHRWLAFLSAFRNELPVREDLLRSANYEDAGRYVAWIEQPELPPLPEWAAHAWNVSASRPKSTQAVLRNAVVLLHGMYDELGKAVFGEPRQPAVVLNPFKPFRRQFAVKISNKGDDPDASGVAKALSDQAWALLWDVACEPLQEVRTAHDLRLAARRRLGLAMLRATWERRAAVAELVWGDLRRARDGIWKVRRTRKGQGPVWEAVPDSLIEEIARFRAACGLPVIPGEAERDRSIYWAGGSVGQRGPISDDTLYRDVKKLFELAARKVDTLGLDTKAAGDLKVELARAGRGPHSIRHTMATQFMAAGGEARRAQEILGHSSIAVTTRVYDTRTDRETVEALEDQWKRSQSSTAVRIP